MKDTPCTIVARGVVMSKQKTVYNPFTVPDLVRHFFLSWLLAVLTEYLILPSELRDLAELEGLAEMSFVRVIAITFAFAVILFAVSCLLNIRTMERWGIVAVFAIITVVALWATTTWAFIVVLNLILVILIVYAAYGWDKSTELVAKPKKAHKAYACITVVLSVAFFLFVSAWTVGRVYSFNCPTFDFGIFSQMFYSSGGLFGSGEVHRCFCWYRSVG